MKQRVYDYTLLTLRKVDLLDASSTSITQYDINALDHLRYELRDEIVRVENQGLEHPCCWDLAIKLPSKAGNPHLIKGELSS